METDEDQEESGSVLITGLQSCKTIKYIKVAVASHS
jgi:hypothetical protein